MEPKESIVEETLKSLDGISRAEANPFLFTRIMNGIENRNEARFVPPATLRISLLVGLLLIGINLFSLLHYDKSSSASSQNKVFQKEYFSYIHNLNM